MFIQFGFVNCNRDNLTFSNLSYCKLTGYRGYKRNADGTRVLAVENGEHSLFDIIEEIRETQVNDLPEGGR